ncbi:MAG TPA: hypothetical protein VHK69_09565, partial [Chitinophagaceae bacterium]|nr:hypothetical protein [Chitinophagaceae bacterium]
FLFEQHFRYTTQRPAGELAAEMQGALDLPWYDLSVNVDGILRADGTFTLVPKLSLVTLPGFIRRQPVALLTGKMHPVNESTRIQILVRPSGSMLVTFYILMFGLLANIYLVFVRGLQLEWVLAGAFLLLLFVARSLMYYAQYKLRERFERLLYLRRDDEEVE